MPISNEKMYRVIPPAVKKINTSKHIPSITQNLGFLQGLKFLKKLMNLDEYPLTFDFRRSGVLDSSNQDSFFLFRFK